MPTLYQDADATDQPLMRLPHDRSGPPHDRSGPPRAELHLHNQSEAPRPWRQRPTEFKLFARTVCLYFTAFLIDYAWLRGCMVDDDLS